MINRNPLYSPLSPIQLNSLPETAININPDLLTLEDQQSEINTGRPLLQNNEYPSTREILEPPTESQTQYIVLPNQPYGTKSIFGEGIFKESVQVVPGIPEIEIQKELAQEFYQHSARNQQIIQSPIQNDGQQNMQQTITNTNDSLQEPIDIDWDQFQDKSLIIKVISANINEGVIDQDLQGGTGNKVTIQFRYQDNYNRTKPIELQIPEFMELNESFLLTNIHSNSDDCLIIFQAIREYKYRDSFLGICKPLLLANLLNEAQEGEEIDKDLILFQDFSASVEIGNLKISVQIMDAKEAAARKEFSHGPTPIPKPVFDLSLEIRKMQSPMDQTLPYRFVQTKHELVAKRRKVSKHSHQHNKSKDKKGKDIKGKDKKGKGKDAKGKGGGKADGATKKMGGFNKLQFGGFGKKRNTDGMDDEDLETLSYNKLMKLITENHPVDPNSKQRFSLSDRITVKNYYSKLFDICCLRKLFFLQRNMVNQIKKFFLTTCCKCCKKETIKWPKPKSLEKIPDSDSSDADDEQNKKIQITLCGQHIGEGSTIYLQMMKTFTILFFILSFINFPIYYSYNNSTSHNNLGIDSIWKYFTIGNIGNTDNKCAWSDINLQYLDHQMQTLEFECPEGKYISELKYFGFFWSLDLRFNTESKGESFCQAAEYPNEPALYLGTKPLGEEPEEECDPEEDPAQDCQSSENEDGEEDERNEEQAQEEENIEENGGRLLK